MSIRSKYFWLRFSCHLIVKLEPVMYVEPIYQNTTLLVVTLI